MRCLEVGSESRGFSLHGHGQPEPIGLEYLAGVLVEHGYNVRFQSDLEIEVTSSTPESTGSLSLLSGLSPDWSALEAAARNAKTIGKTTLLGGYHASGLSAEIIDDCFDYIVIGEGENPAVLIADTLLLRNRSVKKRTRARCQRPHVIRSARVENLDALPFPYREERLLSRYRIFDLMWPPAPRQRNVALVLASRGCVNSCDFCASASVWGRGVRFRSPANVVRELLDLEAQFGTNTIVFIDQSLGQAREWTLDLCGAIRTARLGLNWYHQSNLSIELDVVDAMAGAGCTKIGFGLEGISPSAVQKIKPFNPRDLDSINNLFDYCNSLGLFVKAYLMIGFPWETEKIVKEYFEWISRIRANQIKISYFTPFPGTLAWEEYSGQLLSRNWADFDTVTMPVVFNPHISVQQYHTLRQELFRTFYGSKTYAEITKQMLTRVPHYVESYREFIHYLETYGMISGQEIWLDLVNRGNPVSFSLPVFGATEDSICK